MEVTISGLNLSSFQSSSSGNFLQVSSCEICQLPTISPERGSFCGHNEHIFDSYRNNINTVLVENFICNNYSVCSKTNVSGGARRPPDPNSFIFMQFSANNLNFSTSHFELVAASVPPPRNVIIIHCIRHFMAYINYLDHYLSIAQIRAAAFAIRSKYTWNSIIKLKLVSTCIKWIKIWSSRKVAGRYISDHTSDKTLHTRNYVNFSSLLILSVDLHYNGSNHEINNKY